MAFYFCCFNLWEWLVSSLENNCLVEVGYENVAQGLVHWWDCVKTVMKLWITSQQGIVKYFTDHQLLKGYWVSWSWLSLTMHNPLLAGLQDGASKQENKMKDGVKDESGTVRQHKDTSTTSYITLADRGLDGTVRYTF